MIIMNYPILKYKTSWRIILVDILQLYKLYTQLQQIIQVIIASFSKVTDDILNLVTEE